MKFLQLNYENRRPVGTGIIDMPNIDIDDFEDGIHDEDIEEKEDSLMTQGDEDSPVLLSADEVDVLIKKLSVLRLSMDY